MRYFLAKRTAFNIAGVTWFAWRDLDRHADLRLVREGRVVRRGTADPEAGLEHADDVHRRQLAS